LFESIAYGLGWIDTMPAYNVGKANAETNRRKEYAISDLKGELTNLKNDYKHLLETLLVIPEKTSAYYPASALTQLEFIEGKIRLLSDALKTNDYEWCKQEKENALLSHQKDTSSIKRKSYGKAIAAAATLLIGGIWGTNYMGSVKDREEFNQTIQQGDAFLSTGSYNQAISSYKDAYTNYDAFNSSSYKDDAFQKMEEVTDRLIEEGKNDNTSLLTAYQTIQSELELDLTSSEKEILKNKLESVESDIATRIKNGYNTLALNISANKGKLDDTGKKLLDELLKLSPNDYWLNFIKNKEQ
jgi:hypothetical protein